MTTAIHAAADEKAIRELLDLYLKGGRSGRSDDMRGAFHADAMIHGYIGDDLFAGPIAMLFEWHDDNGPAENLTMTVESIDIAGTIATARVELFDWTGYRFTDMFTLLKSDGKWSIISKVFYLHG